MTAEGPGGREGRPDCQPALPFPLPDRGLGYWSQSPLLLQVPPLSEVTAPKPAVSP
jgi:hypothetical protein